jgi:hypothetical protein
LFAYSFDLKIDLKKSSVKDSMDCGILYRLAIKSAGAYSINNANDVLKHKI